jgi:uncharacterized protein YndB with AHSA1/START domain
MSELAVTRTLHIAAHPSAVWAALTEAELISEWFGDTASIDLRVGGTGVMGWKKWGDFRFVVEEVDEPRVFAFRWAREPGADPLSTPSTLARFTLAEHDGGAQLTVVETGWEGAGGDIQQAMAGNDTGWLEELGELKDFLEKQDSV